MKDTARQPGFGVKPISAKDRFDPEKAVPFARSYLNALSDKYKGNVANTLAAYNWGPGNVDRWLKSGATFDKLPDETRNYVVNILANRGSAPPQPEVRGFIRREEDQDPSGVAGNNLMDLSNVPQDDLDDMAKIQDRIEARELARRKAAQKTEDRRRVKLFAAAKRNRSGKAPAPNFRPAPSGGGARGFAEKAFSQPAISTPPVDPLATQNQFVQGLLIPGTEGGLLGASNLGPTGLLRPVPRRS
jgi:hypothetical protein